MADQIPYESPIWELTATELNVAYLSLTLTKREIASRLAMTESTVGTHLTHLFEKLGLAGFPDDQKRSLLKDNFGLTLEQLVAEVQEDYQDEYRRRRKEALEKKAEIAGRRQTAKIPAFQPTMQERPPEPRTQSETRRGGLPRIAWFIAGFLVLFGLCSLFGINFIWGLLNQTATNAPQANTQVATNSTAISSVATQNPIQPTEPAKTATFTSPPPTDTLTSTPAVLPTAVPLPIREDFSKAYSELWQIMGDPFVAEAAPGNYADYRGYRGILTAKADETTSIQIGNTAWTDYVVSLREAPTNFSYDKFAIGIHVIDLNNMIIFECDSRCDWVVIYKGERDVLLPDQEMFLSEYFILTVQGDTFVATGDPIQGFSKTTSSLILPPRYKGIFTGGGVYLQMTNIQLDYIEIQPFP